MKSSAIPHNSVSGFSLHSILIRCITRTLTVKVVYGIQGVWLQTMLFSQTNNPNLKSISTQNSSFATQIPLIPYSQTIHLVSGNFSIQQISNMAPWAVHTSIHPVRYTALCLSHDWQLLFFWNIGGLVIHLALSQRQRDHSCRCFVLTICSFVFNF